METIVLVSIMNFLCGLLILSQHSRSQTLVKEENYDRLNKLTLNLAILMETKLERNPLGHNSLRDASYQNPGMVLNGKRPSWCPIGDASCHDLCTVSKEQGSDHCFLSCMLH